jgi:hypothetical protein
MWQRTHMVKVAPLGIDTSNSRVSTGSSCTSASALPPPTRVRSRFCCSRNAVAALFLSPGRCRVAHRHRVRVTHPQPTALANH